jgi:hypothetical protein
MNERVCGLCDRVADVSFRSHLGRHPAFRERNGPRVGRHEGTGCPGGHGSGCGQVGSVCRPAAGRRNGGKKGTAQRVNGTLMVG